MSVEQWNEQHSCCARSASKQRLQILEHDYFTIRHRRSLREQHQNDLDLALRGAVTLDSVAWAEPSRKLVCPGLFCASTEKQRRLGHFLLTPNFHDRGQGGSSVRIIGCKSAGFGSETVRNGSHGPITVARSRPWFGATGEL